MRDYFLSRHFIAFLLHVHSSVFLCANILFLIYFYHSDIIFLIFTIPITQSILLLVLITYVNNDNRNKMHFGYWEHQFPNTNNVGSWGVLTNHFEMPLQVLLFKKQKWRKVWQDVQTLFSKSIWQWFCLHFIDIQVLRLVCKTCITWYCIE